MVKEYQKRHSRRDNVYFRRLIHFTSALLPICEIKGLSWSSLPLPKAKYNSPSAPSLNSIFQRLVFSEFFSVCSLPFTLHSHCSRRLKAFLKFRLPQGGLSILSSAIFSPTFVSYSRCLTSINSGSALAGYFPYSPCRDTVPLYVMNCIYLWNPQPYTLVTSVPPLCAYVCKPMDSSPKRSCGRI